MAALFLCVAAPCPSQAAEGGVSFWLPGTFGSFAAGSAEPGWSSAAIYLRSSADAAAGKAFARGGRTDLGIDGQADLLLFGPTYTLREPIWDAQASFSLLGIWGRSRGSVEASLTGPGGGTAANASKTQSLTAFGDIVPQFTLKWSRGVDSYMAYVTGDIPVGSYDADRLANTGLGHGALDGGVGYTYLNPDRGREFSIVGGLTYNFENPDTDYQNGLEAHIDWAASQFVSEKVHVGFVGYAFQQITGDSGEGAILGNFKSRVFGIGPQIGYQFEAMTSSTVI